MESDPKNNILTKNSNTFFYDSKYKPYRLPMVCQKIKSAVLLFKSEEIPVSGF